MRADSKGNLGCWNSSYTIILMDIQFLEIFSCQSPQDCMPQRAYFTVLYFTYIKNKFNQRIKLVLSLTVFLVNLSLLLENATPFFSDK